MRVALFCGSVTSAAVLGAAAWWSMAAMIRNPTAEHFLLFELPSLLLASVGAAGIFLIGRAWPYREGDGLCCVCCGHSWSAETNRLNPNCQECGAPWRWFGGRVRGRPVRRPGLMSAGMLLCLLILGVMVLRDTAAARLASSSPVWLLVRNVELAPWHRAGVHWNELMSRTLSPAEKESLAGAILRKRSRDRVIPGAMASWIDSGYRARTLPPSLVDRWFDEMFEVRLSAPQRALVGEGVPVLVRAQYTGGWPGLVDQAQVVVAGLTVGGESGVRAREHHAAPASLFAGGRTLVNETLHADKEGPFTVKLRVYFFIGPPSNVLSYDNDGEPELGECAYVRKFELEHTVGVDPAPAD